MTKQLPEGWVQTTLGAVCAINPRAQFDHAMPNETEVSFVPMAAVEEESGRIDASGIRSFGAVRGGYTSFQENDVLFAKITPCMENGKIALAQGLKNGFGFGSTEFIVFRPYEGLLPRFLLHFLLQPSLRKEAEHHMTGASGQKRVPSKFLQSYEFWLPPLEEQARIVAKLDSAIAKLEHAASAARRANEKLDKYRSAVLNAAMTGQLTRQWREANKTTVPGEILLQQILVERRTGWEQAELHRLSSANKAQDSEDWKSRYKAPTLPLTEGLPKLPTGWVWASAEQLTEAIRPISYGVIKLGRQVDDGVPVLRSSDVRPLRLELGGVKRVDTNIANEFQRTYLRGEEVLVTVRGTLGGVVSVPLECLGYNISREVAMLALVQRTTSLAVAFFIASPLLQDWMARRTRGIAYTGINIETLRQLPIPVPPLSEQQQIVRTVNHRLSAAIRLQESIERQLVRAQITHQSLLQEAFAGRLVPQGNSGSAISLLDRMQAQSRESSANHRPQSKLAPSQKQKRDFMKAELLSPQTLKSAWESLERAVDARRLFDRIGLSPENVVQFYETLRATPVVRDAFKNAAQSKSQLTNTAPKGFDDVIVQPDGRFRLVELWLEDFKNLKDYTVHFDPSQGLDVVLGWNGTGKSNLFEALVIIFRDLHGWWEKNRWPDKPICGFHLAYELDEQLIHITWRPSEMRRPELKRVAIAKATKAQSELAPIKRDQLPLPRFIFGYYSGPTNRLAEHFLPMKQDHYDRLRQAKADDAKTLAKLLEQRRFFCAETHHAKYVLLGFSYKEDAQINEFLEKRLRIVGFESALFIIRKPQWAKSGAKAEDFWGATGIMRRVMERLRRYAIAPMVLQQKVSYGYRSTTEDHYYFFLPDLASLHSFAAEYEDARTFFLALESTDFSELIHDVKIQVRVRSTDSDQVSITFHQLSEGEQQLLMVLGLMRFTKSHQSLVLLDEPDTHLNPHWSVDYIKDLSRVMSDGSVESTEQQTSQILMATHDPLVIASLMKEQIHLLKRDAENGKCRWEAATVNPRGLGFTGILTSEMFGFRSDLDPETLADLDNRVRLIANEEELTPGQKKELEEIDKRLSQAGFSKAFSDPYYSAFVRAWGRRSSERLAGEPFLTTAKREEIDRIASEVLKEALSEVGKGVED